MQYALGLIETVGLTAAIQAADGALKTADVKLAGIENSKGNGRQTVFLTGDVSSVTVAVEAGAAAAGQIGDVYASKVIAAPSTSLKKYMSHLNVIHSNEKKEEENPAINAVKENKPKTGTKKKTSKETGSKVKEK